VHMMRLGVSPPRLARLTVAALAVATLAGCSSSSTGPSAESNPAAPTSTTAAAPATRGAEAALDAVPWSQVGPGWMLATWSPVSGGHGGEEPKPGEPTFQTATTTLYLVDPEGGRYPVTTFPPPGDGPNPRLVDWAGDGTRALAYAQGNKQGTVIEVDLHTGKQTSFTVDGFDVTPRYSRPQGKAVLLVKDDDVDSPAALRRVDLTGKPQLTYPVDELGSEFNAAYLSNPEGTQLVLGTKSGLALMGNDGSVGKPLPIAAAGSCQPTRWFNTESTVALASCYGDAGSRLWLVPVDGSAPSALTAPISSPLSGDLGDTDAWRLPKATYVQASGACGHLYLATLGADGATTPVAVPNVDEDSSVVVLGANGGHLNLQATVSCGTGQSLLDYDTDTNTSTVLLGPPVNDGGVIAALPYPSSR
jgi:hypothetical protein